MVQFVGLVDCTTYESCARDAKVHIIPAEDSEMPLWFVLPESLCRFAAASISPLPPSIPLSCVSVGFDRRETRKGKHFQMIQLIEERWRESEADSKLV